ncbi:MAG: nuclear transport factor 2 family protein [Planctomycetes bacterium]|nr:nuclear transport factor 2 family protein [Planctomycetota bacterium]
MSITQETLQLYLDVHNSAIDSGDFAPLIALFEPDGELHFVGIEFGPFVGHDAIAAAFRERPPVKKLALNSVTADGNKATAIYATAEKPDERAGTLVLTTEGPRIRRLTISVIKRPTDG